MDSGHFLPEENPEVTAKLLRSFSGGLAMTHLVMPAKASIQYAADSRSITRVSEYWIIRLRPDDDAGWQARSYRRTLKNSLSSVAASVSPTAE